MTATQTERVITAAKDFRGVCQVDFLGNTIDGKPAITRLAARIFDAEQQGHVFEVIGWRQRCKVYRWVSGPVDAPQTVPVSIGRGRRVKPLGAAPVAQDALFAVPARSPYDGEAA